MAGERANPLRDALKECRSGLVLLAVFSFFINLLILTSPIYMMQVYDRVLTSGKTETLVLLTVIAGIAVLVLGMLEMVRNRVLARIGQWLDRRLSPELIRASLHAAIYVGLPNAQPLRDLVQVRALLGGPGCNTLFDAPWTPIFLAVIWLMHPVLGMIGVASAIVLFAVAVLNELISRTPLKHSGTLSIANIQRADQAVRNADAFHAMGMLPSFLAGWRSRNESVLALQLTAADRNAMLVGFSKFIRIFVQILILGAGASLVIDGQLTSGVMIAASILLGRALAPVDQAIGAWKGMVAARDSYDRLKRMLERVPAEQDAMPLPAPKGKLTCEQVIYVPRGRDKPVLNGVTFALEPGEILGVIGPSAAGKSTLCKILVGSWQPTRGHARLDGADLFGWPAEQLGPHVGYLPQDVELFGSTVKDNIARLAPESDPEVVVEAAMIAGVHEAILRLPNGYDTDIGDGGSLLSGGQRQRIGLARALYGKPRLIVLDEPNASLDAEGEDSLMTAMDQAKQSRATVIIVAHQPRILKPVDRLLLLRDGRSEIFGPRDQVLAKLMPARGPRRGKAAHRQTQIGCGRAQERRGGKLDRRSGDLAQELQPTRKASPAPTSRLPVTLSTPIPSLRSELRGPALLGAAILAAFFVVVGGWAATAPLSGAAIAPGVISPEGSRRRVQHLEGGIIHEILVRDGDRVQAGDVLMTLATIGVQSEVGQLMSRLRTLAATEARLLAEREGSREIAFHHPVLRDRPQPEVRDVIEQQVNQLITRRANDASQESILTQRIAQLRQQIVGAEKQLLSVRRQNELIKEEVVIVKEMYEKGYERKSRLLSLQRTEADLTGQEGELLSRIARAEEQIGETKLQIVNITIKRKEDVDKELADTQSGRSEVEQQISQSLDRLSRTTLVAPVSGTVLDLRFKTIGGVVRAGEEVLSIVPTSEKLMIDARLSPQDIDDVHAGQHAYVIFPSFPQRSLHRIDARVRTVSADALQEEHTGRPYYKAEVEIDREQLHKLDPQIELMPGMPAEAFIATTKRTLLEYLIQPLLLVVEHSFREH